jgi:tetratricopeptide (TPR) repeat protein
LTLAVLFAVAAVAFAGAGFLALDSEEATIWIEPFTLPVELVEPTPDVFVARLRDETRALAARARAEDELAPADAPVAARYDAARGGVANASRAMRRLLGGADRRIVGEVTLTPEHADVLVRERGSQASVRSRVPRTPHAVERLATVGAEDLLLVTAPLDVAVLALHDPRTLADVARLDEIATMLARAPAAAADPRAIALRGAYEAAHGRCREALALFDRVIAQRPQAPTPYLLAAECHARLGDRERALDRLAIAAENAQNAPLALARAGEAYVRVGELARGLELLRAAQQRDAASAFGSIAIGEALLALHRPAEALAWLAAHPVDEGWQSRWLGALGLAQVRSGQGPAADATAGTLRTRFPSSTEALRIEAELAAAMKAWPQALGRFGALRLVAPGDGHARAGEGQALLGLQRPVDAIAAYRGCADVAPWLAECRLGLGIALREADQAEAALVPLAEAATLDALDPRIPFETARTLRALLRRDEAPSYSARAEVLTHKLAQRLALP